MEKPINTDQYIANFPKEKQVLLQQVRTTIKNTVPFAEETISYGIPAFKFKSVTVWFAGYKNHIGLYPMYGMEKFNTEIEPYKGKATKATLQFSYEKPLPLKLIAKLVKYKFNNINQNKAK